MGVVVDMPLMVAFEAPGLRLHDRDIGIHSLRVCNDAMKPLISSQAKPHGQHLAVLSCCSHADDVKFPPG